MYLGGISNRNRQK